MSRQDESAVAHRRVPGTLSQVDRAPALPVARRKHHPEHSLPVHSTGEGLPPEAVEFVLRVLGMPDGAVPEQRPGRGIVGPPELRAEDDVEVAVQGDRGRRGIDKASVLERGEEFQERRMEIIGFDMAHQPAFGPGALRPGRGDREQGPAARRAIHHPQNKPVVLSPQKRGRVGALIAPQERRETGVPRDWLGGSMPRTFRPVGPGIGQAAVGIEVRFAPVIDHVVAPVGVNHADVGRVAAVVEHSGVALKDHAEVRPGRAAIPGAQQPAPARRTQIALPVFADIDEPVPADRIVEEEPVHRPGVRRRAAMDRIARPALEGIERGIAVDRMANPVLRPAGIGVVHGRRPVQEGRRRHPRRGEGKKDRRGPPIQSVSVPIHFR